MGLTGCEVLPELVVDGVGKDVFVGGGASYSSHHGCVSQINTTCSGLNGSLWNSLGFYTKGSPIASCQADHLLSDNLKSKVSYQCRHSKGMAHLANSRIDVREGCVISVTTLRVALQSF